MRNLFSTLKQWSLRWRSSRILSRCQIDKFGCVFCGGKRFGQHSVIDDVLADTWGLSTKERQWFDEREGGFCFHCRMSKRVRMLLWSLRRICPDLPARSVLHLNQVNELGPALAAAGHLVETVHRPELRPGTTVGGYRNEDLCRLTFPDQQFDLVIHSETLEHLADYEEALKEATRVLKPGGFQIYSVPLLHDRQSRQRIVRSSDGSFIQVLPPSAHGGNSEYPVVWEFGKDFIGKRRPWIYQIHYDDFQKNPTIFTIIERQVQARYR